MGWEAGPSGTSKRAVFYVPLDSLVGHAVAASGVTHGGTRP